MTIRTSSRVGVLGVALVATLAAGCATMDETPSAPPPGAFSAPMALPPTGTRWVVKSTVHHESAKKTQTQTLTWTTIPEGVHEGKPVARVWDGANVHVRDRDTGSRVALLDRNGREVLASTPSERDYSSPLWVGKKWVARFSRHERLRGQSFHDVTVVWTVEALEDVQVPAGTFKAFRLSAWPDARESVTKLILWYAPEIRLVVKELREGLGRDQGIVIRDTADGLRLDWDGSRVRVTRELVSYTTAAELLPPLMAAIHQPETRLGALWDVAKLGPLARGVMPALVEVLRRDPSATMRAASASAVRAVGITVTDVGALVPTLGDADVGVRAVIADLLKPHAGEARSLLERQLREADAGQRNVAARALGGLGRAVPADALPALGVALDDAEPSVRATAVQALGDVGLPAMAALRGALRHRDAGVRAAAVQTIIAVPEQQANAIPAIIEVLEDADSAVRARAVQVLGSMGSAAGAARERLTRIAERDPSPEIRELAKRALEDLGPR